MESRCTRILLRRGCVSGVVIAAAVLAPALAGAEDPVVVNISGPLKAKFGQKVTYDVELINVSGRNLEKLSVVDYFDEGFHHVASKSPIKLTQTVNLPAGTKTTVKLDFELDGLGRQCHRVEIVDQAGTFMGGATDCCLVEPAAQPQSQPQPPAPPPTTADPGRFPPPVLVPPPVTAPASTVITPPAPPATAQPRLELTGPTEALAGTPGKYKATIRNLGAAPTPPGTLKLTWDEGLSPQEASLGFKLDGSSVSWGLPAIEPGRSEERDLVLRAEAPPTVYSDSPPLAARINAELAFASGLAAAEQRSVAIRSTTPRPRPRSFADADIRLSLADLDDPVRVGDVTTLVCTVTNAGTTASGPLNVFIDLPRGARPAGNYRARVENGRVLFDPLDVPPGGQKTVEISYQVTEPGRYTANAGATAMAGTGPTGSLDRSCDTEFLPR